jgi:hypothetical protein
MTKENDTTEQKYTVGQIRTAFADACLSPSTPFFKQWPAIAVAVLRELSGPTIAIEAARARGVADRKATAQAWGADVGLPVHVKTFEQLGAEIQRADEDISHLEALAYITTQRDALADRPLGYGTPFDEPVNGVVGKEERTPMTISQRLTAAIRKADVEFESVGGSSRHYVAECLEPAITAAGLAVVEASELASLTTRAVAAERLAMPTIDEVRAGLEERGGVIEAVEKALKGVTIRYASDRLTAACTTIAKLTAERDAAERLAVTRGDLRDHLEAKMDDLTTERFRLEDEIASLTNQRDAAEAVAKERGEAAGRRLFEQLTSEEAKRAIAGITAAQQLVTEMQPVVGAARRWHAKYWTPTPADDENDGAEERLALSDAVRAMKDNTVRERDAVSKYRQDSRESIDVAISAERKLSDAETRAEKAEQLAKGLQDAVDEARALEGDAIALCAADREARIAAENDAAMYRSERDEGVRAARFAYLEERRVAIADVTRQALAREAQLQERVKDAEQLVAEMRLALDAMVQRHGAHHVDGVMGASDAIALSAPIAGKWRLASDWEDIAVERDHANRNAVRWEARAEKAEAQRDEAVAILRDLVDADGLFATNSDPPEEYTDVMERARKLVK